VAPDPGNQKSNAEKHPDRDRNRRLPLNSMETRRPAEVFPPGDYIREELEARGWTQSDLARIIGRTQPGVNDLINGRRGITPETALALSAAFGTSAEFWMNLETVYSLSRVRSDIKAIRKRAEKLDSKKKRESELVVGSV
jgi:HTH-type transcriptional regulator/antitoxin HigA